MNKKSKRKKTKIDGTIKKYRRAIVSWVDISSDNAWLSTQKARRLKPCVCYSVCWILEKTDEKLITFADWSPDEEEDRIEVGNLNTIPIHNVKRIKTI